MGSTLQSDNITHQNYFSPSTQETHCSLPITEQPILLGAQKRTPTCSSASAKMRISWTKVASKQGSFPARLQPMNLFLCLLCSSQLVFTSFVSAPMCGKALQVEFFEKHLSFFYRVYWLLHPFKETQCMPKHFILACSCSYYLPLLPHFISFPISFYPISFPSF